MKTYLISILNLCLLAFATSPASAQNEPNSSLETDQGRPVGPGSSPDEANGYVDNCIHDWFAQKLPDRSPKINPQEMIQLATGIKRLGVTNLIAVYGQTKPDIAYRMNAEYNPQDEMKRAVLEKALSLSATDGDISNMLALYDKTPLILSVLVDHTEWDSNPHLVDFLITQLDQIPAAYSKSDLAPTRLFELAARNTTPAVVSKFDSFIVDIVQNANNYPNGHVYLGLIATYCEVTNTNQANNATIQKHLPDIIAAMVQKAKTETSDPYTDITAGNIFGLFFANLAIKQPSLFAAQSTKDAINKLVDDADNSDTATANAYIVSAVCGSKSALRKLADKYNSPEDNASTAPGFIASQRNLIKAYLSTINCQLDGDKLKETTDHASLAIYDPVKCTWTIPKDNGDGTTTPNVSANAAPAPPPHSD
jgi:hypothetical protein